jgi:Putative transposase of IS4/5 family (DUF4096)
MAYPSDLTDAQWELIKDHFSTGNYGKSRKYSQRDLINAVFYIIKTGCQWRCSLKIFRAIQQFIAFIGVLKGKEYGKNDARSCEKKPYKNGKTFRSEL